MCPGNDSSASEAGVGPRPLEPALVAKLELLGDGLIAGGIGAVEVIQQAPALADHDQQAAARAVIFVVFLKVPGQRGDALGEEGNLHVGGTGVFFMQTEILHDL